MARPWTRASADFQQPNLLEWTRLHRADLLAAIFTLARAWIIAGRPGPEQGTPELGSYEAWRNVIGGILSTAGISGFLGNMAEFYDTADEDTPQWSAFLEAWLEAYQDQAVTTGKVTKDLREAPQDPARVRPWRACRESRGQWLQPPPWSCPCPQERHPLSATGRVGREPSGGPGG